MWYSLREVKEAMDNEVWMHVYFRLKTLSNKIKITNVIEIQQGTGLRTLEREEQNTG